LKDKYAESPKQKEIREAQNKINLDRIRSKIAKAEYAELTNPKKKVGVSGFVNDVKSFAGKTQDEKNEFKFVLTYGFGFISMMFLGFLSGYFLGVYGLEWDHTSSLVLSIVVGSGTVIGETILLVIRMTHMEENKAFQTE